MKTKEIQVKVSPHSSSLAYYTIEWRRKRKYLNFLNPWKLMVEVHWSGGSCSVSYSQPVLFPNPGSAVEYANKLKKDPSLIDKHYEVQDKIYIRKKQERLEFLTNRNRTIKL